MTNQYAALPPSSPRAWRHALIVDSDSTWLRALSRALCGLHIDRVSAAPTLDAAQRQLKMDVDLLLTEVVLEQETCFPLLALATQLRVRPTIVAFSAKATRGHVFRLHQYGVNAYLDKPIQQRLLEECLRAAPLTCVDRDAGDRLLGTWHGSALADIEPVLANYRARYRLTSAETAVLRCAASGMSHIETASERGISVNTVKTQARSLLGKCGVPSLRLLIKEMRTVACRLKDGAAAEAHRVSRLVEADSNSFSRGGP